MQLRWYMVYSQSSDIFGVWVPLISVILHPHVKPAWVGGPQNLISRGLGASDILVIEEGDFKTPLHRTEYWGRSGTSILCGSAHPRVRVPPYAFLRSSHSQRNSTISSAAWKPLQGGRTRPRLTCISAKRPTTTELLDPVSQRASSTFTILLVPVFWTVYPAGNQGVANSYVLIILRSTPP